MIAVIDYNVGNVKSVCNAFRHIGCEAELNKAVDIPVIASGGAGKLEHLYDAIVDGDADAVLMASVTHFETISIREMKQYLRSRGIAVNL